jgi:hypothetical protein
MNINDVRSRCRPILLVRIIVIYIYAPHKTLACGLSALLLAFSPFRTACSPVLSDFYLYGPQLPRQSFNVQDYGAKGKSSRVSTQGSMSRGSTTLTCPDCTFTNADVGKKVYVYGASNALNVLSLGTSIQVVLSMSTATLAAPATQSTSGALVQIVGTDDTKALFAARDAACAAATSSIPAILLFPSGGVYTLNKPLQPCSNIQITGSGTILQTAILGGAAAGQGASAIAFPKSLTGRWCSGGTMQPGSNVLDYGIQGDRPCNFTPGDVGSKVVVQYAGQNYLPLYATITSYVSNSEVILDQPAQTPVPVRFANLRFGNVGTFVQVDTTPISNVEIHDLILMNVSTAYPQPGRTLGVGIIAFGADPSSLKQNIRVHHLTVMTASNNCLGGINGFLDQYSFQYNTLIGCADASIYAAGWNSRGTVSNNIIENVNFPGLAPKVMSQVLVTGILVKNASNVTFANNRIDVNVGHAGIAFGDHPQFQDQVLNNTITVAAEGHGVVGIIGNIGDHILLRGNQIECQNPQQSLGILFYSNAVANIEATGNIIRNCKSAISFVPMDTAVGPANVKVKDNQITACDDGIILDSVGGVNVVKNNNLRTCSGSPWVVRRSQSGSVTYFHDDNDSDNAVAAPKFDNSVRRLPKGASPPQ